jgi:tetratricopeptide (TPR) repeat protein
MKIIFIVVFSLLLTELCIASNIDKKLQQIESEWAIIYYATSKAKQSGAYQRLLIKTNKLVKKYPEQAEPIILLAIITATNAGVQNGFSGLSSINVAKDLLLKAISLNPYAFDGAAFTNLGTLYYMVPGWPIAFGDHAKAKEMLNIALKINPDSIDGNYYYGKLLLTQNKSNEARKYFMRALEAPARPEQQFADNKLQEQARKALEVSIRRKISTLNTYTN